MKLCESLSITAICLSMLICADGCEGQSRLYTVKDGHIVLEDTAQYYIGTNVWYASEIAVSDPDRLTKELDTLKALGLWNLRILATDENFKGMDIVLKELRQRGMSAVLYLNNAWEWSADGYRSYLAAAGAGKQPLPAKEGYKAYTKAMSEFASNPKALSLFQEHVKKIVKRYKNDSAVFSWQICNEPRPFARSEKTDKDFINYIQSTARLIKSIDPNHLVSTGSEGAVGCEGDIELFEKAHDCSDIDYLTIHIWPYNWGWVHSDDVTGGLVNAIEKTNQYIDDHLAVAGKLGKPVVIEEFGYPRDRFAFVNTSSTTGRDEYYRTLFKRVLSSAQEGGTLAGCNFWSWSGYARQTPGHKFWKEGDDLCGDPSQEAQGLNSVYLRDTSTIAVIKEYTSLISSPDCRK